MTLLRVVGLSKRFGGVEALRDVSFAVGAGERVALIGPNGAGKTTCFNILNGQIRSDAGAVAIDGADATGADARRMWRRGVGRTFQITETFLSMTTRENLQLALLSRDRRTFRVWRPAAAHGAAAADALLARVGLAAEGDKPAAALSYGDRKRLELAMALSHGPRLLLMDEPTAGMAAAERAALMRLVDAVVADDGVGVLFTEHDMDVVFAHADRILVLDRGALIADGAPEAVRRDPQVRRVYLGADDDDA